MSAVDATQVASAGPITTTERLEQAWSHASQVTRRATVLAAGTSLIVGATSPGRWPTGAGIAAAGVLLTLAALVDVHEHRLPNRLLGAAAVAATLPPLVAADVAGLGRALLGGLLGGGLLLLARLRGGVGMGDVKAGVVVGSAAVSASIVAAPVAIAIAATTAAIVGMCRGRRALPLGPALWFGWAAASVVASMGHPVV